MILTTLCHIEKDGCYLMLYRNKKQHDVNGGKWVGVGGKFEPGETAEQCVIREVKEETGLTLSHLTLHGKVEFISDEWEDELIYIYTANGFSGELTPLADSAYSRAAPMTDANASVSHQLRALATPAYSSSEGELHWIPKEDILSLPIWEGDKLFLKKIIAGDTDIDMTLEYKGDTLVRAENNNTV